MNQKDKAERLRGLLDALENYTEVAVYRESNGNWVKHFLTEQHGREYLPQDIMLDQISFFDSKEEALEYFYKQTDF